MLFVPITSSFTALGFFNLLKNKDGIINLPDVIIEGIANNVLNFTIFII